MLFNKIFLKNSTSKKFQRLFLFIIVISLFLNALKVFFQNGYQDFSYFYFAARAFITGYNSYTLIGPHSGFLYPPISLLFILPFQYLPISIAGIVWTVLSIVTVIISVIILLRIGRISLLSNTSLIIFSLVFLYFPVRYTLGEGQINSFILLLLTLAFYYYSQNKKNLVGILFGLTISLKYFPLFILPYLILRRQWKITLYLLMTLFLLSLVAFVCIGQKINYYYYTHTAAIYFNSIGNSYYYNQALSGFVAREIQDNTLRWIIRDAIAIVLLGMIVVFLYKYKQEYKYRFSFETGIILIISILLNAYSWQHHFIWLILPMFITFLVIREKKLSWKYYTVLGFVYILTAINIKTPSAIPPLLQSHVFYGAIILLLFDLFLITRETK